MVKSSTFFKSDKSRSRFYCFLCFFIIFIVWGSVTYFELVPRFMLPSPLDVLMALYKDAGLLAHHASTTLQEAFWGVLSGIGLGFIFAVLMLFWKPVYWMFYPLLVLTQTIPTIALAPLLVLWMGFDMAPKIVMIVIFTFFPITVGLYEGFNNVGSDHIRLFESMGASKWQTFMYLRLPSSVEYFFASLKISISYAIVGAVVSEWMGGFNGLGVYMVRVRNSYEFDKMFAVIFIVCVLSLLLMGLVVQAKKWAMPWKYSKKHGGHLND